jgi:ethanolamine utilization protein EutQ (cupin superfamily)
MKVFTREELVENLVDHPYDTNPGLLARVNFFYFSPDRKLAMAYYESPPGWFDVKVAGFDEIDAVLEGEVELVSGEETLTARAGDCFLIQDGDQFRWRMNRGAKMFFFIYPLTRQIEDLIASFYRDRERGGGRPDGE